VTSGHNAVGIGLAILSAFFYNGGLLAEKYALGRLPDIHARKAGAMVKTLASSPLWLLGFVTLLAGLGLQVLALSVAPISLVQPVFASGLVLFVVLSHLIFDDHMGTAEWVGVGTVLVALVALGLSVDPKADKAGAHAPFSTILIAAIPTAIAGLGLFYVADHATTWWRRGTKWNSPLYGMASGLMYGIAALGTKGLSTIVQSHGVVASIPRILVSPNLYLLAAAGAVGLVLFQTAFQRCSAPVLVPVSNVVSSAYLIAVGSVIFGERLPSAPGALTLRMIGFAGVVIGLGALAFAKDTDIPEVTGGLAGIEQATADALGEPRSPGTLSGKLAGPSEMAGRSENVPKQVATEG